MSELRKISVCQNSVCQNRGSKNVLHRLNAIYDEQYKSIYPKLQIVAGDCMGDCELGPVVKINDSILLRHVDAAKVEALLENPDVVLGEVMHVLQEDRETFDRIVSGDLF